MLYEKMSAQRLRPPEFDPICNTWEIGLERGEKTGWACSFPEV